MPRSLARLSSDDIASDAAAHLAGEVSAAMTLTLGEETIALTDEARVALGTLLEVLASGQRVEVVRVVPRW